MTQEEHRYVHPPVQIEEMDESEIPSASALVREVFLDFVAPQYSDEGQRTFLSYIEPEALLARLVKGHKVFVARADGRPVGLIEFRERNHISLLFVRREFQGQGIARRLLTFVLAGIAAQSVTVNASPNAVLAYRDLGFEAAGEEQVQNGIRFIPMVLHLPRAFTG